MDKWDKANAVLDKIGLFMWGFTAGIVSLHICIKLFYKAPVIEVFIK